jgi:hypothetical protein
MEATADTADDLQSHRVEVCDATMNAKMDLNDLRSTLWGLEEHLQGAQGSYDAQLRTALRALEGIIDDVETANESAGVLHEAAKE